MPDPRDTVDLSDREPSPEADGAAEGARPYLRVYFSCANQYTRVYRRPGASNYTALCPRCGKSMRFMVGEGGTSERFFQLSCR